MDIISTYNFTDLLIVCLPVALIVALGVYSDYRKRKAIRNSYRKCFINRRGKVVYIDEL